jgi:hypothetical protein
MIDWTVALIEKSIKKEVHIFSLDFSSALMANVLHATSTHEYFTKNTQFTKNLMVKLLKMIRDKVPTSVLMHLLICLSYLNKEKFAQ